MEGTMPAYVIATVKSVTDRRGLEEYWSHAAPSFAGSGATHLAAYTPFKLLEGKGPLEAAVLIEFPDMEAADQWYESAAYQAAKQYRVGAAEVEIIVLDGGTVTAENRKFHSDKGVRNS
jgi:uncharacterized protein (DUF1330 family)